MPSQLAQPPHRPKLHRPHGSRRAVERGGDLGGRQSRKPQLQHPPLIRSGLGQQPIDRPAILCCEERLSGPGSCAGRSPMLSIGCVECVARWASTTTLWAMANNQERNDGPLVRTAAGRPTPWRIPDSSRPRPPPATRAGGRNSGRPGRRSVGRAGRRPADCVARRGRAPRLHRLPHRPPGSRSEAASLAGWSSGLSPSESARHRLCLTLYTEQQRKCYGGRAAASFNPGCVRRQRPAGRSAASSRRCRRSVLLSTEGQSCAVAARRAQTALHGMTMTRGDCPCPDSACRQATRFRYAPSVL